MIRNERYSEGQLVSVETLDLEADLYTFEQPPGTVLEQRPLTDDERDLFLPPPPTLEERLADAERPDHVDEWVMPTGAHDAPNIGDHRWHEWQVWRSLIDGNTTEPGSDDRWWESTEPPAIPDKLRDPLREVRAQVESASNTAQLRDAVLAVVDTLTGDV